MAKTTKIKTVASVLACQSKDQVMDFIRQIGDKQREIIRIETRMNDKIAEIEAEVIAFLAELNEQINQLEKS